MRMIKNRTTEIRRSQGPDVLWVALKEIGYLMTHI